MISFTNQSMNFLWIFSKTNDKPFSSIPMEVAASSCVVGLTAIEGLLGLANMQQGQKVKITRKKKNKNKNENTIP